MALAPTPGSIQAAFAAQDEQQRLRLASEDQRLREAEAALADETAASQQVVHDPYGPLEPGPDHDRDAAYERTSDTAIVLLNEPTRIPWDDYVAMVEQRPEELYTGLHRIIAPPRLENWDDVNILPSKVFLDYFLVVGRRYKTILDANEANFGIRFKMRAGDWATPMNLKAGSIGFSIVNSSFLLGTCDLGKLFLVWTASEGGAGDGPTDEDGFTMEDTPLRANYAAVINDYIASILATDEALKSLSIHASSIDPEGRTEHTYKEADLGWAQACALCSRFMKDYVATCKPRLGSWGSLLEPRFVMFKYGQDEPVPEGRKARKKLRKQLQDAYGSKLSSDVESISVSWATELYAEENDILKRPIGIFIDHVKLRELVEFPNKVTNYPIAFLTGIGNAQGSTAPLFIRAGLAAVSAKLSSSGRRHLAIIFESFNFYNCLKQRIRANPRDFVFARGIYTVGLGVTREMLTTAQWNSLETKNLRYSARTFEPELKWNKSLNEITAKTAGARLEFTVRLDTRALARDDRNWGYYIDSFMIPTSELVLEKMEDVVPILAPLLPGAFPRALKLATDPPLKAIKRIVQRLVERNAPTLTLAEREIVAILERLLLYAASGTPRINLALFKSFGLHGALRRGTFPYMTQAVNVWNGTIDFSRYHPSEQAQYAHVAAISFAYDKVAGSRANGLAEIERSTMSAAQVNLVSETTLKHIARHFVRSVLLPEFREAARTRYLAKVRDLVKKKLKDAAGDPLAVEEVHEWTNAAYQAISSWYMSSTPFAIDTILPLLVQVLSPRCNHLFVATLTDRHDDHLADRQQELPKDVFHSNVFSFTAVATHIILRSFDNVELDVADSEGASIKSPRNQSWPGLLRALVNIDKDQVTFTTGADMDASIYVPELIAAVGDGLVEADVEVWPAANPGQLNGDTTWLKLHALSIYNNTAVDTTPHVVKKRRLNGTTEAVSLDFIDTEPGVPVFEAMSASQRLCRTYDLRFNIADASSFPRYWVHALAAFRETIKSKVECRKSSNAKYTAAYRLRWERILRSIDFNKPEHWYFYTLARVFVADETNIIHDFEQWSQG